MAGRGLEKYAVYPKIIPADVSGSLSAELHVPFAHLNYSFTVPVSRPLYEGAKASSKAASVPAGIGDAWLAGYYRAFALSPLLVHFYADLLKPFRNIRREKNLDADGYLELLTAYVQALPYDTEKTASISLAPRFPVETVADGRGICSDKSLLLAGMLAVEGYAAAVLHFQKENHLAVGIPAPDGFDFLGTGYAVIETTAVSYVGTTPCGLEVCRTRPKVIRIGNGTKTYSAVRDTAKILAVIAELEEKLNPDGRMTAELLRLKKSIEEQTAVLRTAKAAIEQNIYLTAEDLQKQQNAYKRRLAVLQRTIHQYNMLAQEFRSAQELAVFIRNNRLDRAAVSKRLAGRTERP
ncbi:MAG: hypothetical protein Q4Q04_04485 [Methanocorpusculum sp.]|nr:hypothetical protein [Methanocorpusculum sp.]